MTDEISSRRYSGRSADERDDERRRRLREAGLELFGSVGYAGTSVERLCTEAKVSTRHFYQLHPNKESAFLDVYETINARALAGALAALAQTEGESMKTRLPQALLAYLAPMVEDIRVARIAFVEIMGVSPEVERRRLAQRESLIDLITAEGRAAAARGEVADRDWRTATLALSGSANAIIYDWAHQPRMSTDELEAALTGIALTLLT